MWNIMINAVEAEAGKPVPQLMYGRYNGKNIYIPGSGSCDIPEGGIYLDLSDHNSPDSKFGYHVWVRNNAGTLELSATTDDIASTDGIKHKSGASGYRYLGDVYPVAIHTGHYGPVDCEDRRLVWNSYNRIQKFLGKRCPAISNTYEYIPPYTTAWTKPSTTGYDVDVLGHDIVNMIIGPKTEDVSGNVHVRFVINGSLAENDTDKRTLHNTSAPGQSTVLHQKIDGYSSIGPYFKNYHSAQALWRYCYKSSNILIKTTLTGSCWC
jgi:hypothetical protein